MKKWIIVLPFLLVLAWPGQNVQAEANSGIGLNVGYSIHSIDVSIKPGYFGSDYSYSSNGLVIGFNAQLAPTDFIALHLMYQTMNGDAGGDLSGLTAGWSFASVGVRIWGGDNFFFGVHGGNFESDVGLIGFTTAQAFGTGMGAIIGGQTGSDGKAFWAIQYDQAELDGIDAILNESGIVFHIGYIWS